MTSTGGGLKLVAIGFAVIALGLTATATAVVMSRGGSSSEPTAGSGSGSSTIGMRMPDGYSVAAADLVRLKREAVTAVLEHGNSIGLKVTDPDLLDKLGLHADDVLTALSGRKLVRDFDLLDAISGIVMLDAKTVYVELEHFGKPTLVRWQIDGDLKAARRASFDLPPVRLPSVAPVADPLVATIEKIDDTHYTIPRDTADKFTADPATYTKGVRGYASFGTTEGLRIFGLRIGTIPMAIGIINGDVVQTINGESVTSTDQLDERLRAAKSLDVWTMVLDRRGTRLTITITVK